MTVQRDEAWVKTASPEQTSAALRAGELVTYLGGQTPEQQAHAAHVAGSVDRISSAAYGLTVGQAKGNGSLDSSWFAAKRRDMDATQLEKLNWVESSTPDEVYAAEQAGELDHLLGRDVSNEEARIAAIVENVRQNMEAAK